MDEYRRGFSDGLAAGFLVGWLFVMWLVYSLRTRQENSK